MVRATARQAQAERERRAKVQAAHMLVKRSEAMQLRYLQTLTQIANERASTIVFPVPLDVLRPLLERR